VLFLQSFFVFFRVLPKQSIEVPGLAFIDGQPQGINQNVLQKSGWNQWNPEEIYRSHQKPMFSYYSHNQLTKILEAVMRFVPSTHSTSKTWLVYVLGSLRTTTDFCNHVLSK
jgi:hypothetical protein